MELVAEFNSAGAPNWDTGDHPSVFIVAEGIGFGGRLGAGTNRAQRPGLVIFDAATRHYVTSANFDVASWGWDDVQEPHGLGVSPDGAWIYLPTGENEIGRLLIINARTLKVDKVLQLRSQPHFIKAFRDADGNPRVLVESFDGALQATFVLDPIDDNRVVGGWDAEQLGGLVANLSFTSPDGTEVFVLTGSAEPREPVSGAAPLSTVVRIDTGTWNAKGSFQVGDLGPSWLTFSADDKFAYVNGAVGYSLFQYDRLSDRVVAESGAGVQRPYGTHLGWHDRFLYSIGGEPTSGAQRRIIGRTDTALMAAGKGADAGSFDIECTGGGHATLHPDPQANQFWITCDKSAQIVVFDIADQKVVAHLTMPNKGSSHAGAFVNYQGREGEVTSDVNGLQGSALLRKRQLLDLN